jgi:hypothetical protein
MQVFTVKGRGELIGSGIFEAGGGLVFIVSAGWSLLGQLLGTVAIDGGAVLATAFCVAGGSIVLWLGVQKLFFLP